MNFPVFVQGEFFCLFSLPCLRAEEWVRKGYFSLFVFGAHFQYRREQKKRVLG